MQRRQTWRALLGLSAAALLAGCAGAGAQVTAKSAAYPLSLSASLPDGDGRVHTLGETLQPVGALEIHATQYGIFYGAMRGVLDISSAVNERVRAAGGEGVVRLAIRAQNCALNWFFPFTILPFWPGCHTIEVTGVIVRRRQGAGAPKPAAEVPRAR
ncbi:MAG: hypothetical protein KC503_32625 [Myxococcales bacterium]|nr:hypothetical protein [Myxococcales bacterium]